jgi:hypothetical protein
MGIRTDWPTRTWRENLPGLRVNGHFVAAPAELNNLRPMNLPAKEPETSAWEEARRQGVDMELLEASIRMTPEERFREHRRALRLAMLLAPAQEEEYEDS